MAESIFVAYFFSIPSRNTPYHSSTRSRNYNYSYYLPDPIFPKFINFFFKVFFFFSNFCYLDPWREWCCKVQIFKQPATRGRYHYVSLNTTFPSNRTNGNNEAILFRFVFCLLFFIVYRFLLLFVLFIQIYAFGLIWEILCNLKQLRIDNWELFGLETWNLENFFSTTNQLSPYPLH